ncbi:MAG: type II CAAX endopeptidase family protein [Acidobacteriota bacterium]
MSTSNEVPTFSALEDSSLIERNEPQIKTNSQNVDPNNPVWGVGGALGIWIASIVVQAIIPLLFVIPFAVHRGLNPSSPDFGRSALELAVTDRTAIFLQVLSILPTHILTLVILWAFVTRFGKRPFLASFGWGWSRSLGFLEGFGYAGIGVVLFITGVTLARLLGADKPTQLEQLINSSTGARYAIAALAVFTAPFVEEFIYRGVVYSALQRAIGVNGAVVFVLGLFTLIHVPQYWPNIGVISAVALLSIVLTIVRAYTGRLLPCIIIHMSFNAVQALLLILEPYLQRLLPATPPAVPTSAMLLPALQPLIRLII